MCGGSCLRRRISAASTNFSVVRLVTTLFDLAEAQGTAGMARPWIAITQKELGHMVGLSRESTNKHLRDWAEAGWIGLDRGGCRLLNPAALRALRGSAALDPNR